jgi:hypothetical protein
MEESSCPLVFQVDKIINTRLNNIEVGKHTTNPPLVDVWHATSFRFLLNRLLGLLFCAYEEDVPSIRGQVCDKPARSFQQRYGQFQVENVNTIALNEDVFLHLGVPPTNLVSKVGP